MTFTIKIRGVADRPIAAEYMCPVHGRFGVTVPRDANGDAPSEWPCTTGLIAEVPDFRMERDCNLLSPYVISAPRYTGVRRIEAVKGGWEKPARPTFLDTRELGEGQDIEEFRDKRAAIRDQERRDSLKDLLRE